MNNASKGRCVTITPSDKPDKNKLFMPTAQSENEAQFEVQNIFDSRNLTSIKAVWEDRKWIGV